ncbi:TPA: hypothetical protein ACGO74_002204, partial [Streptococcus suis]
KKNVQTLDTTEFLANMTPLRSDTLRGGYRQALTARTARVFLHCSIDFLLIIIVFKIKIRYFFSITFLNRF